ncbi:MAG: hypothetical protein JWM25_973 [Thermoleophilia bacterium]|nr:hypothetical protein [Thermoleophilia bacterium]MCZ4496390.1 hypothetical protein [Thermoleophilia bacterium]
MTIPSNIGSIGSGLSLQLDMLKDNAAAKKSSGTEALGGAVGTGGENGGFAGILKSKLTELNASAQDSSAAMQSIATGTVDDVAQTMLRVEQASINMQMATQVRNKVLEAYQEVLRMQM